MRGFREAYGSWKIICIRRRIRRSGAPNRPMISVPSNMMLPSVAPTSRITAAREGRLAAAGFAHQPNGLAASHVKRHAVDGAHVGDLALEDEPLLDREVHLQVANLQQRRPRRRLSRGRGLGRHAASVMRGPRRKPDGTSFSPSAG